MALFLGILGFEIFQKTQFFLTIHILFPTILVILISVFTFIFSIKQNIPEEIGSPVIGNCYT